MKFHNLIADYSTQVLVRDKETKMINKLALGSRAAGWNPLRISHFWLALRWLRIGLIGVAALTVGLIAVQLFYPTHLARPLLRLDGQSISLWSAGRLADYTKYQTDTKSYKLTITGQQYSLKPAELGISTDDGSTVTHALSYSLTQRLIPLSLFFHSSATVYKNLNSARMEGSLRQFAEARAHDPTNASLKKDPSGEYTEALYARNGFIVNVPRLKQQLASARFGSQIVTPLIAITPDITQPMVQSTLSEWKRQTSKYVSVLFGEQKVVIPTDMLQKWLSINTNQKQDDLSIDYDREAIAQWLSAYVDSVYVAPTPTVRQLQDGEVSATSGGSNGSTLDMDKTTDTILAALTDKPASHWLTAVLRSLDSPNQDIRSYSPTSKGLQALIADWNHQHGGTFGVSFQELGGPGRTASLNADKVFFAASIYKLYVAAYIYKQMENGDVSNSLVLANNKTVNTCLEAMIVNSDNDCAKQLAEQFGWDNITAYAQGLGFSSTSLADRFYYTNTSDTASYLQKLYSGGLLNGGDTSDLLDKMSRQIYRTAIPAGSIGDTVYDKVGIYDAYWHDAAIVVSPKATYVLVVFSSGSGPGAIKDLAYQIKQTLNN